jgi:uncharacterized protein
MSEIATYLPGTPCYVDLWTPDRTAAMAFYGAVFGWEYEVAPADQHFYTTARIRGLRAAGIITPPGGPQPPAWVVYLATDDVAAVVGTVGRLGGRSLTGVVTVPGADEIRMALLVDPTGAMVGAWQARDGRGAQVANEPGSFIWTEEMTPDPVAARTFYTALFGLEISDPISADFDYTTIRSGGRNVGGIGRANEGVAARWYTYFAVADTDAAVEVVRSNGGTVVSEPADSPYGRAAVCTDPQGAEFTLIRTSETG